MARKKSASHMLPEEVEFNFAEDEHLVFENPQSPGSQEGEYQRWMMDLLVEPKFQEHFDIDFRLKETADSSGNSVSAHRLILATRNSFFADFLRKGISREIVLIEPSIPVEVFRMVMCFIYTGRARISTPPRVSLLTSLIFAAKKFQVAPLYDLSKEFIVKQLSSPRIEPSQIIVTYQSALDLDLKELFPICCHLLEQRTFDIKNDPQFVHVKPNFLSSLLDLDVFTGVTEREMFQSILRWARIQIEMKNSPESSEKTGLRVRKVMEPFIHKFRLASIMRDDLTAIITESGVFTEKEQLSISLFLLGRTADLGSFSSRNRRVLQKQTLSSYPSISADSGRESFSASNLSSSRSRMSRSFGNLSRLSIFDMFAPLKKRKPNRDKRRENGHHRSMHDIVFEETQTTNASRLTRTNEATASLSNNSASLLETIVRDKNAYAEPLPPPFVRRICGIRKKSDQVQPIKPQRHDLSRENDGSRESEEFTFHIRAIDVAGLKLENKPSTIL